MEFIFKVSVHLKYHTRSKRADVTDEVDKN